VERLEKIIVGGGVRGGERGRLVKGWGVR